MAFPVGCLPTQCRAAGIITESKITTFFAVTPIAFSKSANSEEKEGFVRQAAGGYSAHGLRDGFLDTTLHHRQGPAVSSWTGAKYKFAWGLNLIGASLSLDKRVSSPITQLALPGRQQESNCAGSLTRSRSCRLLPHNHVDLYGCRHHLPKVQQTALLRFPAHRTRKLPAIPDRAPLPSPGTSRRYGVI